MIARSENPITILLVDDREENLLTLEAVLSSPDYKIVKAKSGDEALRFLLDHEPALILMDVQMPELTGFETAAILKKSERTREIPIIFVTAIDKDERFARKGYDYGAVDYIFKPFDIHILKSKVAVFADLYRKTQRIIKAERQLRENETHERERKIAELELKSLRREQSVQMKYRDLVEGIEHGIVWSATPDMKTFSFVSATAERLLGFLPEIWMGEVDFWDKHIFPGDKDLFREAVRKTLLGKASTSFEHRFVKANGKIAWLQTGIRVASNPDGNGYELRGLSVEITNIKDAETIRERSKQRSDFLARASFLLSSSFDYQNTLKSLGEFSITRFSDIFSVDLIDDKERARNIALVGNEKFGPAFAANFHERFIPKTGTEFGFDKVLISGKSQFYEKSTPFPEEIGKELGRLNLQSVMMAPLVIRGETVGALSMASAGFVFAEEDILLLDDLAMRISLTIDNANLYRHAQASVQIRDEFLSIASHELKTPITPLKLQIQMLLRLLKSETALPAKVKQIVNVLESSDRQIERLTQLVNELLDISKISMGKLSLQLDQFDLIKVIQEILQRFSGQMNNAGCSLRFNGPDTLLVKLDQFRMEQVIVNLLTNAIKYAPGKEIEIKVEDCGSLFSFSIRDQGIGIAKTDQARIFKRFERAVSGNHFGGLGLGLYIVKQILEAHSGEISVESEPGKGSNFKFLAPKIVTEEKVKMPSPETGTVIFTGASSA